jgi:alcohol dehydrogenase
MRAVVYDAPGAMPRLDSVPPPECPADGVVIEVAATGVCRSDWHAWRGHEEVPLPHIGGHEFAGTVVEVGRSLRSFAVGERVTSPFVNGCGRCEWCRTGRAQVCPDQTQPGFTHAGSFAERVAVRAADHNLVRLPDEIDMVAAAALGCRFATAFRALTGHGPLAAGDWVAVFGCGGVGLSAVMIARALGARVVAVDPSAASRAGATELGAVTVADASTILDMTGGGAHVSLDAYGSAATAGAAVRSLRRGGRHVQVGLMLGADAAAPLPWDLVIARELRVAGSHGMAAVDYPPMLEMVADGRLQPGRLVGAVVGLGDIPAALAAMDDPIPANAGMTVAVRPAQSTSMGIS